MDTRNAVALAGLIFASACLVSPGKPVEGPAGPAGPKGDTGPTGPQGPAGSSAVTLTALDAGDANCAEGGAALTTSSGTTYACNGATGPAGMQGPAGPQGDAGAAGPQGPPGPSGVSVRQADGGVVGVLVADNAVFFSELNCVGRPDFMGGIDVAAADLVDYFFTTSDCTGTRYARLNQQAQFRCMPNSLPSDGGVYRAVQPVQAVSMTYNSVLNSGGPPCSMTPGGPLVLFPVERVPADAGFYAPPLTFSAN